MAYRDFSYEEAELTFGLTTVIASLFPDLAPVPVPAWLPVQIERNHRITPYSTEKARSESVVYPVLTALEEIGPRPLALFCGHRLDVDSARGLVGERDYLLARTQPVPRVRAPLLAIIEAKRGDVEASIGQGLTQMLGARLFNERAGDPADAMWGCVTSGQEWQFLRLEGAAVRFDSRKFFTNDLGLLLAALVRCVSDPTAPGPAPAGA